LIVPFPESSLNEDAGKLFMEDYETFKAEARLITQVHARPRGHPALNYHQQAVIEGEEHPRQEEENKREEGGATVQMITKKQ
jgi:hypothetical protein